MAVIRLTKEFSFEMAHTGSTVTTGPCREIHGHSYRLFVTVKGRPKDDPSDPKCGMVIDFGDLKRIVAEQIVGRYDHALVMRRTESNAGLVEALRSRYSKLEVTDYQPTCENMVADFAARDRGASARGRDAAQRPAARDGHVVRRVVRGR